MSMHRMMMSAAPCLLAAAVLAPLTARSQSSYIAPDGQNRYPAVTIFCPNNTGVTPCNFGGSGGTSLTLGGSAISASNKLPVSDSALDALISGGALKIGGGVTQSGSWTVNLAAGSAALGSVGVSSLPPLPAGTNAIGSVTVANFPATQPISGAVSESGSWTVSLNAGGNAIGSVGVTSLPALPAGSNAIGSVTISNLPATQPVSGTVSVANLPATQAISASALPLPAGAATSTTNTPVAPGTATATNATLLGCLANTTLPSFAAGQQGAVPCDTSGRPYVVTVPSSNNVPSFLQAVASGGYSTASAINTAASAMPTNVKAGAGMVYAYTVCNSTSASVYLRFFNQNNAPTVGTSTPFDREIVPAGLCVRFSTDIGWTFSNGISFDITAGSLADNDTSTIANANTVTAEVYYK